MPVAGLTPSADSDAPADLVVRNARVFTGDRFMTGIDGQSLDDPTKPAVWDKTTAEGRRIMQRLVDLEMPGQGRANVADEVGGIPAGAVRYRPQPARLGGRQQVAAVGCGDGGQIEFRHDAWCPADAGLVRCRAGRGR
jgi:hypothetical protein